MSEIEATKVAPKAKSAKAIEPRPEPLRRQPETVEELFYSLAGTVERDVDQPVPDGETKTRLHHYAFPWPGWGSWRDARNRLVHFERAFGNRVRWAPFNDSSANDGPMTLNAFAGRAFIERVTNSGDACLELKALSHKGPLPMSPSEAVAQWYGLTRTSLSTDMSDEDSADLAKQTVRVRIFAGQDAKDPKDCIIDARDFGIGVSAEEMPGTILSLNRGLKKSKLYVTGKHGQGASSTYQYSDLTLIASRKHGTNVVAFTLVEKTWDDDNGGTPKTPTYRYLTVDGKIPQVVTKPDLEFPHGTLVRHIGYNADFTAAEGDKSMYGLLLRSLAQPLFPVWLEQYFMRKGSREGVPTFAGFRAHGRQIRGTINVLERAWDRTVNPKQTKAPQELSKVLHRSSEVFKMGTWDFGGRTGVKDLGQVKITYWVVDPADRTPQDVLKNWVDPNNTVIFTLDGQTHAEESRSIVTGQSGAKLWAVGKYMVVQIDCDSLAPQARYEMFTSTREHVKETPIKGMIMEEIARRLILDKKLEELNAQLAAAGIKKSDKAQDESLSSLIKKYLKKVGLDFEKFTKRIQQWKEIEEQKEVPTGGPGPKEEPPPIEALEPPTFIRWRFKGDTARMYPGQKYSWVFETDAPPHYWNDAEPASSKIRVLANGVEYIGGGEMKGGRVRCHFRCAENAVIGTKGVIQAQLEWQSGAAKVATLPVEIVAKPEPKPRVDNEPDSGSSAEGDGKSQTINVKVKKKDFTEVEIPVLRPIPLTRADNTWNLLNWGVDPAKVGFSIRSTSGQIQLYYNAEFPPFLDMKRRLSKRSLEDAFVQRYEMKLVLHTIFTLNYEFADEDDVSEETRKHMRSLLCAAAESLCLAAKTELEIEARIPSDFQEELPAAPTPS